MNKVKNEPRNNNLPYVGHEFEVVKYRHEDQVKLLQWIGQFDMQLFSGYLTIQLAFGSFLIKTDITDNYTRFGLLFIEISMSLLSIVLLTIHHKRRIEIVETVRNCNEALGLTQEGAILKDKAIDSKTKFRPWNHWYSLGVLLSFCGICLILFRPSERYDNENSKQAPPQKEIFEK